MPLGNVPVLLEAAQGWLDLAPCEFVTAPCKRIAINFAAKRSRTTQFQIYSVKVCPQGPEGAPCGIDCRTRRLALLVRSTHLTTAIHRRRNNISAGRAGRRWCVRRQIANPAPRRIAVYSLRLVSAWQSDCDWTNFAWSTKRSCDLPMQASALSLVSRPRRLSHL